MIDIQNAVLASVLYQPSEWQEHHCHIDVAYRGLSVKPSGQRWGHSSSDHSSSFLVSHHYELSLPCLSFQFLDHNGVHIVWSLLHSLVILIMITDRLLFIRCPCSLYWFCAFTNQYINQFINSPINDSTLPIIDPRVIDLMVRVYPSYQSINQSAGYTLDTCSMIVHYHRSSVIVVSPQCCLHWCKACLSLSSLYVKSRNRYQLWLACYIVMWSLISHHYYSIICF